MRTPQHLASGRWKVRFYLSKKPTSETFNTEREALRFAKLLDALGPVGALRELYAGEQIRHAPTMDQLAADHIAHLPSITDGTRLKYTRLWAATWSKHIGGIRASEITRDALSKAIIELSRAYSAKSLKNQRGLLSGVLDRGVRDGHLSANPAKGLRLPRGKEHERIDMVVLTADDFRDLLERVHLHYQPFVMFLAGTGCRFGEAVALQVGDVALPNVRIRRALKWSPDGTREIGPTKTKKSNRTIMLPPQLVDVIKPLLDRPKTDLLFTAPKGGMIQHRRFWGTIWQPAVKGMDPRPRVHDLRHSHASWLLAAGVPIHVVQARLGHESIQTTVDTYSHLLPDAQIQAANAAALVFKPKAIKP